MLQIEAEVVGITRIFSSSKIRAGASLLQDPFQGLAKSLIQGMHLKISGCGLRFTQWRLGARCDVIKNHQNELLVQSIHHVARFFSDENP